MPGETRGAMTKQRNCSHQWEEAKFGQKNQKCPFLSSFGRRDMCLPNADIKTYYSKSYKHNFLLNTKQK